MYLKRELSRMNLKTRVAQVTQVFPKALIFSFTSFIMTRVTSETRV